MSGERQQSQKLTFLVQITINMYSQIMAEQRVSTVIYRRFLNHDFDLVKTDADMIHDAIPSEKSLIGMCFIFQCGNILRESRVKASQHPKRSFEVP